MTKSTDEMAHKQPFDFYYFENDNYHKHNSVSKQGNCYNFKKKTFLLTLNICRQCIFIKLMFRISVKRIPAYRPVWLVFFIQQTLNEKFDLPEPHKIYHQFLIDQFPISNFQFLISNFQFPISNFQFRAPAAQETTNLKPFQGFLRPKVKQFKTNFSLQKKKQKKELSLSTVSKSSSAE